MNSRIGKQGIILSLIFVLLTFGFVTRGHAGTQLPPLTVYVPATVEWTFTGLKVQTGQELWVNSVGYACTAAEYGIGSTSDPGGQTEGLGCGLYEGAPPPCALNFAPYGMLIGKIVTSKGNVVFAIGNADKIVAPASGKLYLSINDNLGFYDDNLGRYLVTFK